MVHFAQHLAEEVEALVLVNQEGVFLLVDGTLHVLAQVVHVAEVFLPVVVNHREHNALFQVLDEGGAAAVDGLLEVGGNLKGAGTIGEGHQDALHVASLLAQDIFEDGEGLAGGPSSFLLVVLHGRLVGALDEVLRLFALKFGCREGGGNAECFKQVQLVGHEGVARLGVLDQRGSQVVGHVGDVDLKALAGEGVAAAAVDALALRIHHIIVLQEALTHAEVVLFDLLLGALDGLGHHGMLDDFAFDVAHSVHQAGDTLRAKQTHEVVLQAHEELRRTGVALTARTTTQLAVHTARIVALRTDDG